MTIEKTVLDVLVKEFWDMIKDDNLFTDYWHPADKDLYFKEIAKSISDEIKVVSIDRDELTKEIEKYIKEEWTQSPELFSSKDFKPFADKILSLLEPVKTLNKKEVEEITNIIAKEIFTPECKPKENSEYHLGFNVARNCYAESKLRAIRKINQICNLAVEEGDK